MEASSKGDCYVWGGAFKWFLYGKKYEDDERAVDSRKQGFMDGKPLQVIGCARSVPFCRKEKRPMKRGVVGEQYYREKNKLGPKMSGR